MSRSASDVLADILETGAEISAHMRRSDYAAHGLAITSVVANPHSDLAVEYWQASTGLGVARERLAELQDELEVLRAAARPAGPPYKVPCYDCGAELKTAEEAHGPVLTTDNRIAAVCLACWDKRGPEGIAAAENLVRELIAENSPLVKGGT